MIAVIVPTVNRADMLEALVANIHEATDSEHRVYLVMEHDDSASVDASLRLDSTDVIGSFGSCAIAVNEGYRYSTEPFVAVVNDDCVFHPGWDTKALEKFSDTVQVVGLNDGMGDPKSFFMVWREFIKRESGVFDKPDQIFHEGYKSQGPDTEFSHYAMLRGVWDCAPDAVVEHRNWRNGSADPDHPNYLKARDTVLEDLAEYQRRASLWDPDGRMPAGTPTVSPR